EEVAGHLSRFRIGTAGRLALFHALVIATVLGIVVLQFTQAFASRYQSTIISDLSENVSAFSHGAAVRPATQSLKAYSRSFLASHGEVAGDILIITIPSNHLSLGTVGSGALAAVPTVATLLRHPPRATVLSQVTLNRSPQEVMAAPIIEGGKTVGTFLTAGNLAGYESARARVLRLAIGEGLITLFAATISVYLLLRRLLGSVNRLTRTARDIGLSGDLDVRLGDQQAGDEVGEMAATFDSMIDRIDVAISVRRRLLADVSHQLRTPLTVMRGHLEVINRGALDNPAEIRAAVDIVVEQLDQMRGLVERLLLLGRSLETDFAELVPVDLRSMLADILDAAQVLAPRHWDMGMIPDVVLAADLDKLRGAVLNLIDNAVNATQPTDTIQLSAALGGGAEARWVDIAVDDSGPGIPPSQRDVVMGRFSRPSAVDGHGTGLGLAIVEAVARAHGGSAIVGDSPLGGCRVIIRLPLTPVNRFQPFENGT
ncbi:MAG: sensor histidine kinase, partial [Acidimicrobiales bacterium]